MQKQTSPDKLKNNWIIKIIDKRLAAIRMSEAKWSILSKSTKLYEINKRMKRWEWYVEIADFLLMKDKHIIDYYKWNKNAHKNLCWVLTTYKLNNWFNKKPTPWMKWYWEYISEINEIEQMTNLVWFLENRIDTYHRLELKSWIPINDTLISLKLLWKVLYVLLKMKISL